MWNRRDVLQTGLGGAAAWLANESLTGESLAGDTTAVGQTDNANPPLSSVRVGFVGIGVKGWQHLLNLLHIDGVEMVAVCDVLEEPCRRTQKRCRQLGMPEPVAYHNGERDFERMCREQQLDLVYTATPWRWHVPVCLAAMTTGSHAATEIPAALTIDECWQLVETSESTGRHLCMMENVNYRRTELAMLRMVREGLLGELVHADVGYLHDTRFLKVRDVGDGLWLGHEHATRNGNLYPTHGLGPVAWDMDLGRGNRMEYLVSMSTKARGMNAYAAEHLPPEHSYRQRDYINGDVNTSLIKTSGGETIVIKHDTDLPRPYSRGNLLQGTKGLARGFPDFEVSLEDVDLQVTPEDRMITRGVTHGPNHSYRWQSGETYYDRYDHPLWQHMFDLAGNRPVAIDGFDWRQEIGGGDLIEDYRLIRALLDGVAPDFDVYDAAAWSARWRR